MNLTAPLGILARPSGSVIHALGEDAKSELYVVRVDGTPTVLSNGIIYRITP